MGLIKSAFTSINSTLHDQWEEYITCDSLDNDTLVVKKTTENGIISNKSRIQVAPGQVALIFDSGKILDATAEEGILILLLHHLFLLDNLVVCLKRCGSVLNIMELLVKNKRFFMLTPKK